LTEFARHDQGIGVCCVVAQVDRSIQLVPLNELAKRAAFVNGDWRTQFEYHPALKYV
jgi:hypothetical protein